MRYALDETNEQIDAYEADKTTSYHCPICSGAVVPRQGECNSWHFAHVNACEDDWSYDMSEWHMEWQNKFPLENRENIITYKGQKHRADIKIGKYIIEFQHSKITAAEFNERNNFYTKAGFKVIWLFDVNELDSEGRIVNDDGDKYCWKNPYRFISSIAPQNEKNIAILLELEGPSEESDDTAWIKKIEWAIPNDDGTTNYDIFYADTRFNPDLTDEDDLEKVMLTKRERFGLFLKENGPYKKKCSKIKGNPKEWYLCEKTRDWHNDACKECGNNLICEYRKSNQYQKGGLYFYCCYPRLVTEPDEYGNIYVEGIRI